MTRTLRHAPALAIALLLGWLLPGCRHYYVVESNLVEDQRKSAVAEVTETETYRRVREQVRHVALRPPDVCEDRGAAEGGGEAELEGGVLRTRCGVEMAELERALVRAGYRVVAWKAIEMHAAHNEVSPRGAAKALGAEVLIQINALERSRLEPGRDARWERRFYASSQDGEIGAPVRVSRERGRLFEGLIRQEEARLLPGPRLAATINASAVLVTNGETIWFYEWSHLEDPPTNPSAELHLHCRGDECERILRDSPEIDDGPVSGSVEAVSFTPRHADQDQVVYHRLMRELVADLVARFSGAAP